MAAHRAARWIFTHCVRAQMPDTGEPSGWSHVPCAHRAVVPGTSARWVVPVCEVCWLWPFMGGSALVIINNDRSTDRTFHWVETIALPIMTAVSVIGGTVSLWLFTGLSFSDLG
jgi:hypothetical protein